MNTLTALKQTPAHPFAQFGGIPKIRLTVQEEVVSPDIAREEILRNAGFFSDVAADMLTTSPLEKIPAGTVMEFALISMYQLGVRTEGSRSDVLHAIRRKNLFFCPARFPFDLSQMAMSDEPFSLVRHGVRKAYVATTPAIQPDDAPLIFKMVDEGSGAVVREKQSMKTDRYYHETLWVVAAEDYGPSSLQPSH